MRCVRCRVVLWGGPSCECHAPCSHTVRPGRQPIQADVCGEHWHRLLHLLCALRAGVKPDCIPPGDQEEALLELWLWGLHCAAPLYCRQCQVTTLLFNCLQSPAPTLSLMFCLPLSRHVTVMRMQLYVIMFPC